MLSFITLCILLGIGHFLRGRIKLLHLLQIYNINYYFSVQKNPFFSTSYGLKGKTLRLGEETELFYRISKKEPVFWYDPQIKIYHWVPVHKLYLKYRFRRSYEVGRTLALIGKSNLSILEYSKYWIRLFLIFFEILYYSIRSQNKRKQYHIKIFEQLGFQLGFILNFNNIN